MRACELGQTDHHDQFKNAMVHLGTINYFRINHQFFVSVNNIPSYVQENFIPSEMAQRNGSLSSQLTAVR